MRRVGISDPTGQYVGLVAKLRGLLPSTSACIFSSRPFSEENKSSFDSCTLVQVATWKMRIAANFFGQ